MTENANNERETDFRKPSRSFVISIFYFFFFFWSGKIWFVKIFKYKYKYTYIWLKCNSRKWNQRKRMETNGDKTGGNCIQWNRSNTQRNGGTPSVPTIIWWWCFFLLLLLVRSNDQIRIESPWMIVHPTSDSNQWNSRRKDSLSDTLDQLRQLYI